MRRSPTEDEDDQANRLIGYSGASGSASYGYDGDGLRMRKTPAGSVDNMFAWDVSEALPLLLHERAGANQTFYIYGPNGLPVQQIDESGSSHFYHHDHAGSTVALSGTSGATEATFTYTSFGSVTATGAAAEATPLLYGGQYRDPESGLVYLRARYYDPLTGSSSPGTPWRRRPASPTPPALLTSGVLMPGDR